MFVPFSASSRFLAALLPGRAEVGDSLLPSPLVRPLLHLHVFPHLPPVLVSAPFLLFLRFRESFFFFALKLSDAIEIAPPVFLPSLDVVEVGTGSSSAFLARRGFLAVSAQALAQAI